MHRKKDSVHQYSRNEHKYLSNVVLQYVAVCCSVLQCIYTHRSISRQHSKHRIVLRDTYVCIYTATRCNTLQHTATHCNTLQHAATQCNLFASKVMAIYVYACIYKYSHYNVRFNVTTFDPIQCYNIRYPISIAVVSFQRNMEKET